MEHDLNVDITVDKRGKLTYRIDKGSGDVGSSNMSESSKRFLSSIPANVNPTMLDLWGLKTSSFTQTSDNLSIHRQQTNKSVAEKSKTSFVEKSLKAQSPKGHSSYSTTSTSKYSGESAQRSEFSPKVESASQLGKAKPRKSTTTGTENLGFASSHSENLNNLKIVNKKLDSPKRLTTFAQLSPKSPKQTACKDSESRSETGTSSVKSSEEPKGVVTYKNPSESDWVVRSAVLSSGLTVHRVAQDPVPKNETAKTSKLSDKTLEMCKKDPYLASLLLSKGTKNDKFEDCIEDKKMCTETAQSVQPSKFPSERKSSDSVDKDKSVAVGEKSFLTQKEANHRGDNESCTSDYRTASENSNHSKGVSVVYRSVESGFGDKASIKSEDEEEMYSERDASQTPFTFRPIGHTLKNNLFNSVDATLDEDLDSFRDNPTPDGRKSGQKSAGFDSFRENPTPDDGRSEQKSAGFDSFRKTPTQDERRSGQNSAGFDSFRKTPTQDERRSGQNSAGFDSFRENKTPDGKSAGRKSCDLEKPKASKKATPRNSKTPRTPSTSRRVTFRDELSSSESNSLSDSVYGIPKVVPKYLRAKPHSKKPQKKESGKSFSEKDKVQNVEAQTWGKARKTSESSENEFEKFWKVSADEWKNLSPYQKYLKYKTMSQSQKEAPSAFGPKRSKFLDSDSDAFLEREKVTEFNQKESTGQKRENVEVVKEETVRTPVMRKENESNSLLKEAGDTKENEETENEHDFKFGKRKAARNPDFDGLVEGFLFSKKDSSAKSKIRATTDAVSECGKVLSSDQTYFNMKTYRAEANFDDSRILNPLEKEPDQSADEAFVDQVEHHSQFANEEAISVRSVGSGEKLVLETYRSERLDEIKIDSDYDDIVSVSTFMPETLRSISEAFSRMDSVSKMSTAADDCCKENNESFSEFLFVTKNNSIAMDRDREDEWSCDEQEQFREAANLEVESASAESLIDKLYEEPERIITPVRQIGRRPAVEELDDSVATFKQFVCRPLDTDKEGGANREEGGREIGFDELDRKVADKFGGQTVRELTNTCSSVVLESVNADCSGDDREDYDDQILRPNYFASLVKPYIPSELRKEERSPSKDRDRKEDRSREKSEEDIGTEGTNSRRHQRRRRHHSNRLGSTSPSRGQSPAGESASPSAPAASGTARSPRRAASGGRGGQRESSNVPGGQDTHRSSLAQPGKSRLHADASGAKTTQEKVSRTNNGSISSKPVSAQPITAAQSKTPSKNAYPGRPFPQSLSAHTSVPAASNPSTSLLSARLVNVKDAPRVQQQAPVGASSKPPRPNSSVPTGEVDLPAAEHQSINLSGVSIKSRTASPHLVRPSSGRRQSRTKRAPSPQRARSNLSVGAEDNSLSRGSTPNRRSRSPSPRIPPAPPSPRGGSQRDELFSKYLTELHTSLIQRSVLTTPTVHMRGAETREKCGNLLGTPKSCSSTDPNMWLNLPPEMWLHVLSLLSPADRCNAGLACKALQHLANDFTLWVTITVRAKSLSPGNLKSIGQKEPRCVSFLQCDFDGVKDEHLRDFFRELSASLQELNVAGCTSKECNANTILVHAGTRCPKVTSLDTSWSNLGPHTLVAFCEHVQGLQSLSVNGCAAITDECLDQVVQKHGPTLVKLNLFGCFKLDKSLMKLPKLSVNLQSVHLGNIPFVTDETLHSFATSLKDLRDIDIRSSRHVTDEGVYSLAFYCRRLTTLIMHNCSQLTDFALTHLGGYCMNLQVLEVDGCAKIGDEGVSKLLVETRVVMRRLGLTATNVSSACCEVIAAHCPKLEELKLSSCQAKISIESLKKMMRECGSLNSIDLYGFDRSRVLKSLGAVNSNVKINV